MSIYKSAEISQRIDEQRANNRQLFNANHDAATTLLTALHDKGEKRGIKIIFTGGVDASNFTPFSGYSLPYDTDETSQFYTTVFIGENVNGCDVILSKIFRTKSTLVIQKEARVIGQTQKSKPLASETFIFDTTNAAIKLITHNHKDGRRMEYLDSTVDQGWIANLKDTIDKLKP